jgi:hypothetical protein
MLNPALERLRKLDFELENHFFGLRSTRDSEVIFLIEHGLGEQQLSDLKRNVGQHARLYGMDRNAWNGAGISLAVLITETGYNYRGTGTDFWPRLENDIGVEISQSGRKSIQKLFESLHQRLGIAKPHESDWSRAFNIIAWPIRNALAPIEIHRKLSAALATLASSGLQGVSNEDFERKLVSVANGLWSRRLSDWLSDSGLAVDLSRRLLTGKTDTSWIEPLAAARVERDIQMDGECSQTLRRARQSLQAKTGSITLPPAKWEIALRSNGETTAVEQLLLRGPNVSIATLNTVLKQHDRSVSIDIGSGENSAVFIERFLQGEAIELKRPEAAFSNIPLCISGRSASEAEISTLLTPLKPTVAALFRWKPFGGLLPAIVKGDEIQMDETILLLSPSNKNSNPPPESLEISAPLGLTARIAPARDFRFEIAHVGAIIVDSLLVQFLSGTKLLGDGRIIGAREDTPLLVRASVDGVELTYDGNALPSLMEKGDIAVLKVRSKPTELEARRHGHVQCHLIESFSEEAAISLSCHMRPAEATLVEFLSGEIVLTITSPVSLAPIKAEISLLQDQSTLAELTLESVVVPGRISLSTSDFKAMRDTAFKAIGGSQDTGWKLSISLGGLGRFDFPLRRKRTQWTRVPDKLLWINEENVSAGPGFMASVAAPLPVADFAAPPNDQVLLWLPQISSIDRLHIGTLTGAAKLFGQEVKSPQFGAVGRSVEASIAGLGVLELCNSMIAWRAASANNVITDVRRRQVVKALEKELVIAFCGQEWAKAELEMNLRQKGLASILTNEVIRREFNKGDSFPILTPSDADALCQALAMQFSEILPDFKNVDANDIMDDQFEQFDEAINLAYVDVSNLLEARGEPALEESDAGNDPQAWRTVLELARALDAASPFRPLILPRSRWQALCDTKYDTLSDDDLVATLMLTHLDICRQQGVEWIGSSALRTGLLLWLSPTSLLETIGWRDDISCLLSDRHTARAIRFVALNARGNERSYSVSGLQ